MEFSRKTPAGINRTGAGNLFSHKKEFISRQNHKQVRFNRDRLAKPAAILNLLGIKPEKINPAGYWTLRCPFHSGGQERNPSLNLHSSSGHYKCHACNAAGGDILAFYMAVTGMKFLDAIKKLSACGEVK